MREALGGLNSAAVLSCAVDQGERACRNTLMKREYRSGRTEWEVMKSY